jgi:hypothetical protein
MTLYEQFLVELQARLHTAITTLFPTQNGGALRGASFALESMQWPGIRLDDGVLQTAVANNDCDMACTGTCSIIITAESEPDRDALINAAYAACNHRAQPWPIAIRRAVPTEVRYTRGGANATAFVATIPIAVGPYITKAYQPDTPA